MATNNSFLIGLFCAVSILCHAQPRDLRSDLLNTYRAQLGVRELTGHNDGVAVETYLRYCGLPKGQPWCASVMCWGMGQNHIVNPRSGYCPDLFVSKYRIWQRGGKNNKVPLPGDLFGIYFPEKGRIAHAGCIEVWGLHTVTTLEGNTNLAGSREGDGFYRKIRLTGQIYAVSRFIK